MRSDVENLFLDMADNGWLADTNGDVESPTGWFGYVVNERAELASIADAFGFRMVDELGAYTDDSGLCHELESADIGDGSVIIGVREILGAFFLTLDSDGCATIERERSGQEARRRYISARAAYVAWCGPVDVR